MRRSKSSTLRMASGVAIVAILAACSSGSGSSGGPAPVPSVSPSIAPTATASPSPSPVPSPVAFTLTLSGPAQSLIPPATSGGTQFLPDERVTYRSANGTYDLWMSAGGTYGADLFRTSDLGAPGAPVQVFAPSGPGTTAFDADYAGPGTVLPAADGTDLLMFYHAENHLFGGTDYPGVPFYAGIGLARSGDGGITWTREGEIISGHDPQEATQGATGAGAATPTVVASGGYLYAIFRELDLQSNVNAIAVARAPIASDGMPGSWMKYDGGSFSTPGLGGAATPLAVTLDPAVPGDRRQPSVAFAPSLGQFVMVVVGNGGIYALASPDLIHWSPGRVILPAPIPDASAGSGPKHWYPTLVSPAEPSDQTIGQTGYLYYANFPGGGSYHSLYRQAFTLTTP